MAKFGQTQSFRIPRPNVGLGLTERRGVGFLRHLANIFDRSHCWAVFLFECHNKNTSGGVRMGVETILLIVILTFVAGFVLDRMAMMRRFDAEKSKTKL